MVMHAVTTTIMEAGATVRTDLPSPHAETLAALQLREHRGCFACGTAEGGLGLHFEVSSGDAGVVAEWQAPAWAIGYDNTVHGGLIATVLDSAMVHALFARGCCARTAELRIRYRHPVRPTEPCVVCARLIDVFGSAYRLESTLRQSGRLCARAYATFMGAPPDLSAPPVALSRA
jgi:acyl-coenzyme A thioesterase PaaI-like protein